MTLVAAKREGDSHFVDAAPYLQSVRYVALGPELCDTCEVGLIYTHYRPTVDPTTNEFVGVDAWRQFKLGLVTSNTLAEQSDLILELVTFAFRVALARPK
jgi:hypothetical protein